MRNAEQDPPRRFRLSRAKGSRKPAAAVVVCRPSKWGNRWKAEQVDGVGWCCTDTTTQLLIQARDRADAHDMAVAHYRATMTPGLAAEARAELRGKDLACWCPHTLACHADYLLDLANG